MLLVGALALGTAPAAAASGELDGLEYVALGDSYSAGFGLLPFSDQPAAGCYQAEQNYPHRVADALGLVLNDRTCSGAVTANIRDTPQLTITGAGTAPVQSDSLSATTDIVTVTIGGNDLGFSSVAARCIALDAAGPPPGVPGFDSCKAFYNPLPNVDTLIETLDVTVSPALLQTFALIKAKAPNARVFVVGYPSIAPDFVNIPTPQPPGCFTAPVGPSGLNPPYPQDTFPYMQVDTLYLHKIEKALDDAIEAAAVANGFTFVPTWDATQSRSACSPDRYVAGITLTDDASDGTPTGITGVYAKLGVLHPNEAGVAFLQTQVVAAIRAGFGLDAPEPAGLPATGAEVGTLWLAALALLVTGAVLALGRRRARA